MNPVFSRAWAGLGLLVLPLWLSAHEVAAPAAPASAATPAAERASNPASGLRQLLPQERVELREQLRRLSKQLLP